jgi:hypothetical protein
MNDEHIDPDLSEEYSKKKKIRLISSVCDR